MTNSSSETFVDDLLEIISKYCSKELVEKIRRQLDLIRTSEETALKDAPDREIQGAAGETELLRRIDLDYVITACKQELAGPDFLELVLEVGNLCLSHGELSKAKELFSSVIATGGARGRTARLAGQALLKRAEIHQRQAEFELAFGDLKRARQLFGRMKDRASIGRVENVLGVCFAERGQPKQARAHWLKALTVFERSKQEVLAGTVLMNLGILANISGKSDEALAFYQRALPRFEHAGQIIRLAELHHNMGMSYLSKREYQAAIGQFDESLIYSSQLHHQPLIALSYLGKASAYSRIGDLPLSMALANKSLQLCYQLNDRLTIADIYKVKGVVQRSMKNWEVAELYLMTSLRINADFDNFLNLAETYYELGLLYREMSEPQKSREAFEQSLKGFKRVGATREAAGVKAELGALGKE